MTKKKELSNTEMEKFSPKDPETYPINSGCGLSLVGVVYPSRDVVSLTLAH